MIVAKPLPYGFDALEPGLSRDQLRFHYERHYLRYVERTNALTRGRFDAAAEAVAWARRRGDVQVFQQAAQAWSHEVYFDCMTPLATAPWAPVVQRLLGADFTERWCAAAESVFGSGWVWLVADRTQKRGHGTVLWKPRITVTKDAEIPQGLVLMVMDVWEHAYWCDYPGLRQAYARAWVERLADWSRLERERFYER